jgi:hypothetical protein
MNDYVECVSISSPLTANRLLFNRFHGEAGADHGTGTALCMAIML